MGKSGITEESRKKLFKRFDELFKFYEQKMKTIESSIEIYRKHMAKLIDGNRFREDARFERDHIKVRSTAWNIIVKAGKACDGDKFDFERGISSFYSYFKKINSFGIAKFRTANFSEAFLQAQRKYIKRMKKLDKRKSFLPELDFNKKDDFFRLECLQLVKKSKF